MRWPLPSSNSRPLAKRISHWISQLQPRQRKRPPAGHVIASARPDIPPYLLLLFLVHVFGSVHGVRRRYTCCCVQGVIAAPRVRQRSQRDVHGVRLRAHDADVLVYDISVITCCGNSRASVALPQWVLCEPSLLDWNDAEYAFLFWMQGGVSGQFRMSPGMRWYTAVGLYTM